MKISWTELRRRKVVRVVVAYAIMAWVLLQVGDTLFGLLELPGWTGKLLVVLLLVGLPVAIVLAWMFDITPEGIVSASEPEATASKRFTFSDLGEIDIAELDLGRPQLTPLIGRYEERAVLDRLLEEAAAGRGGVVLIGGEPGVGKTRLGEEALEMGLKRGMLPLVGRAYEQHGSPFITSSEILEEIRRALPADILRSALGETAPEMARLLPDLRRSFPEIPEPVELPPEQQQRYLFNAMVEFTERLAKACPLVVLLDDIQWADESSMLLLEHMAPQLRRMPLLWVLTYRDVAADMGEPFKRALAQLSRLDHVTRIPLRQLGREDVRALLESLGGPGVPDLVVDAIDKETEGNAFFVKSLYQHLFEEGRLFNASGQWRDDIGVDQLAVPEGVRLVIERRLQRLGSATGKVLALAAISGLRFELGVLEHAFEGADDEVLESVEEAEAAGMVHGTADRREARYEFAHALVRQTILDDLSAARRQRLHLKIANALESVCGDDNRRAADIAHHLYRAGPAAKTAETHRYLLLAGEQALAAAAADEALEFFDRALELDLTSGEKAELLYQKGLAHRTASNWEAANRDWQEALPLFEELGERDRIAQICWNLTYKHAWANEMKEAEILARRGLKAIGEESSVARCQLLAAFGMCAGERLDYNVWEQYVNQAIEMAEELGEERLLGSDILMGKSYMGEHWLKTDLHVEASERSIEIVRRLGSPWELSNVLGASFLGYLCNGRFGDVEANWREAVGLARKYGDIGNEGHALFTHGLVLCCRGRLEEGRAILQERTDWAYSLDFAWKTAVAQWLGMADFWRGDWDNALGIAEMIDEEPIEGTMAGIEPAFRMLILAYRGESEASALMDQQRQRVCIAGQENQLGSWFTGMATLESAAMLGQLEKSAALYACAVQLIEAGSHFIWGLGFAEKFAGVAAAAGGHWAQAEAHFQQAKQRATENEARVELAELLRWRAQARLWRGETGDLKGAQELGQEAIAAYREIGMLQHAVLTEELLDTGRSA